MKDRDVLEELWTTSYVTPHCSMGPLPTFQALGRKYWIFGSWTPLKCLLKFC